MSQATRPNDRHIIWSNQNLDVDDWREDYKEFLEANELDDDPNDEQALYEWMEETNYDYLSDERVNLNVQLSQPIIVIGDIGRWNGRVMGYKDIPSGNIRDCLYPVFYVMANTGMRVGEITGLRWSDIDLKKGIIRVNHTLVYYNHRDEKGCYKQ